MIIDCDCCAMQDTAACNDCIVTALLADHGPIELASPEADALENLAHVGLVSPLRLLPRHPTDHAASG